MTNSTKIELTFTQCKQIIANGYELREVVEQLNDQPHFMSDNTGMQIDDVSELKSILQGGCASNAHNSVFHFEASQCMAKHGDDVLEFLEEKLGELPVIPNGSSWSQIASHYLATAVEEWCAQFADQLDGVDWD